MPETAAADALKPFTRLGELIRAEATKIGLRVVGYTVVPGLDGDPPRIRFAVVLDGDGATDGDPDIDAALKGMLMATEEDERAARREKERERLSELGDLLKDPGKGILGDELP